MTGLISDYLGAGTLAERPADPGVGPGCLALYAAEDTAQVFRWDSLAADWSEVGAAAAGGGESGGGGDAGGGGGGAIPQSAKAYRFIVPYNAANEAIGNNFVGIGQLYLRDAAGTNLFTGGLPVASTEFSSGFSARGLFDGSGGWISASGTRYLQYVAYIWPAEVTPASVSIRPNYGYPDAIPRALSLQGSNDGGLNWFTVREMRLTTDVNTLQTFAIP